MRPRPAGTGYGRRMVASHKNLTRRQRGTLRELEPGKYEVRVNNGRDPATGRRRQPSRTIIGTQEDAEKALTKLLADVDAGRHRGSDMTVAQLLERWFAVEQSGWSPKTRHEYRRLIDRRLVPAVGKRPIGKLRPAELTDFYRGLHETEGLSANSVHRVHAIIRAALNFAVLEDLLDRNPAKAARPPRVPKSEITPPDVPGVATFIKGADESDAELATFLFVAASTGSRRGETCALRWTDIDLEAGHALISRSIAEIPRQPLIEKDTKTHAARRISLDVATVAVLRRHRGAQEERARLGHATLRPDAFLFSESLDGSTPWKPSKVTNAFRTLRERVGMTGRLHDLRHFAATILGAAGVDVRTIAGRLGHANTSTTLNMYSHFLQARDQQAATVLGGQLAAALEPPTD